MADQITVELSIKDEGVKQDFQNVLQAHPEFRVKTIHDTDPPDLLVLNLEDDPKAFFASLQSVFPTSRETEVFITSPRLDSEVLLEAIRFGVKEFLPQPCQREDLDRAFQRFKEHFGKNVQEAQKKPGEVLSFLGGKGGVGITSIAISLSACLHQLPHRPSVVLVDLNQHAGDLSHFLDLGPTHSFRDIAADLGRLDSAFLLSLLTKHELGLLVLPSGYDDLSSGRIAPECIEPTIKLLQSLFDYVIIDCGHVLEVATKKALELSDTIFVASTLVVPVVHRAKRLVELLKSAGFDDKVKLLINRYRSVDQVVLEETEKVIGKTAFWSLPNDYIAADTAINKGLPIVTAMPRSPLTKSFQDLGYSLGGQDHASAHASFWAKLFKSRPESKAKAAPVPA